ncbi:hypothetical protein [Paenibacillus spongiae]|uniref:Uncharacterized protein n=1 Tax=Paenibacillus spongiae TaxID=2909671 RepID=A0ABY5SBR5_9BACL|nr:hypothetical protein [Paenibacillus spongiae]UVI31204.1 hypothetical protein L1F29_05000 [Paenibacillus spongiae]
MENVSLKKRIVLEVDVVTGRIDFLNEDEMSFPEILGTIEYAKMMVMKDWMEE